MSTWWGSIKWSQFILRGTRTWHISVWIRDGLNWSINKFQLRFFCESLFEAVDDTSDQTSGGSLLSLLAVCDDVTQRFVVQVSCCVDVGRLEHLLHLKSDQSSSIRLISWWNELWVLQKHWSLTAEFTEHRSDWWLTDRSGVHKWRSNYLKYFLFMEPF